MEFIANADIKVNPNFTIIKGMSIITDNFNDCVVGVENCGDTFNIPRFMFEEVKEEVEEPLMNLFPKRIDEKLLWEREANKLLCKDIRILESSVKDLKEILARFQEEMARKDELISKLLTKNERSYGRSRR